MPVLQLIEDWCSEFYSVIPKRAKYLIALEIALVHREINALIVYSDLSTVAMTVVKPILIV